MAVKTIAQLKEAFAAGKTPTSADFADFIDTATADATDQPIVLPICGAIDGLRINLDNAATWDGTQYTAIWAEELIKSALIEQGKGDSYDDVSVVILHNDYAFTTPPNDSRVFVKTWDNAGNTPIITVIPNGGSVMFARVLPHDIMYNATNYAEALYHTDSYGVTSPFTAGWRPVGTTIGITEAELETLAE